MKAVRKKRRSGGKNLTLTIYIRPLKLLNNCQIKKIYLCGNEFNFLYVQMHLQRLLNEHFGHKRRKALY